MNRVRAQIAGSLIGRPDHAQIDRHLITRRFGIARDHVQCHDRYQDVLLLRQIKLLKGTEKPSFDHGFKGVGFHNNIIGVNGMGSDRKMSSNFKELWRPTGPEVVLRGRDYSSAK